MAETILLIDDDRSLLRVTEYNLSQSGFRVITADSGTEGLDLFEQSLPDMVITDLQLGDMNGLELLDGMKEMAPAIPVIVITAFGSIKIAVEAMQRGAFHFLTKPFDRDVLRQSCRRALEVGALQTQKDLLVEEVNRLSGVHGMETASSTMAELLSTAVKAAESEAAILITGESGTGKELLARLIHQRSSRKDKVMVSVNCVALPPDLIESELFGHIKGAFTGATGHRKGRFQAADHGTLFLDEIGEMRFDLQAKLLRVLQEGEVEPVGSDRAETVDVRLIAATNKNLQEEIEQGRFREDLYYRLCVIPLYLPPLRERKEDIEALANHFMKKIGMGGDVSLTPEAVELLKRYHWPGNIRELQNVIERSMILRSSNEIRAKDLKLTDHANASRSRFLLPSDGLDLIEVEKDLIRQALVKAGNNQSKAARLLSIPRHVLLYRLEKYNLK